MGAARHLDEERQRWLTSDPGDHPAVGVAVDLAFSELDQEQTDPWCVDDGARIVVMRTRDIRHHLRRGALGGDVKVWRDGRARWLPLEEVYELSSQDEDTTPSRIRRVRRTAAQDDGEARGEEESWWRRTLLMFFGGITLGLFAMMLLTPRARAAAQLAQAASHVTGLAEVVMASR